MDEGTRYVYAIGDNLGWMNVRAMYTLIGDFFVWMEVRASMEPDVALYFGWV